ncbi:MAG: UDP-N-acetylmuramoyl-L-alanyl-D-glutamate--2,6-diaminopimelate ligase [Planctomycetes bacterium]|nr:UDP-N-acetylmuramoyl-L-alanyl-D-glutamate--2,6-diaminopimelate ligase [Planctomycetota bacterium]
MKLSELASGVPGSRLTGPGDVEIVRAVHDSRRIRAGDLFVALPGTKIDGHQFVQAALDAGAAAAVVERPVDLPAHPPLLVVPDAREALALCAHALAGHPTRRLEVCGVTGTNGKTTTTYLVRGILERAGRPTGVLGTIGYFIGRREIPSRLTTPDADDLAAYFAEMVESGLTAAVMEVSSHALHQRRTAGIRFAVGAFTNLTPEHLDYHKDMISYREAKGILFAGLEADAWAVLNADDPASASFAEATRARVLWYGREPPADVRAEDIRADVCGSRFALVTPRGRAEVRTGLLGVYNIYNCLTAAAIAEALAVPLETIAAGLESVTAIPGRLQPVPTTLSFSVLVDYAHKTDALNHALSTVRDLVAGRGRLIVVFGCGGDRDRQKRPKMAKVAQRLADRIVVTNDNPRTEQPEAIARAILGGFDSLDKVTVQLDRHEAIVLALGEARPGDVVVIAGKGHETYQIIGDVTRSFDDREVAAEVLRGLEAQEGGR